MKRRTRSSFSLSRGGAARAPLLCLAAALGLTAAACSSDLFHDTQWQSRCDLDPDASICPQGTGGAGGTGSTSSASATSGNGGAGGTSGSSSASGASGGGATTGTTTSGSTAASSSTG